MRWGRRILGWVWVASVAGSTLLFVAAVGMWGRSYFAEDGLTYHAVWSGKSTVWEVEQLAGLVSVQDWQSLDSVILFAPEGWSYWSTPWERVIHARSWFRLNDTQYVAHTVVLGDRVVSVRRVMFPHWFLAVLSIPIPLLAIRRWRRERRIAREGLCLVCGYDLRASVERCPECGTAIKGKHALT